jgi:hypothetical protein
MSGSRSLGTPTSRELRTEGGRPALTTGGSSRAHWAQPPPSDLSPGPLAGSPIRAPLRTAGPPAPAPPPALGSAATAVVPLVVQKIAMLASV